MAYRTIVVGTDGSPTATVARDVAFRLARRTKGTVVVASAYDPPRLARSVAEDVVARATDAAERQRVRAEAVVEAGDPTELILREAERRDADLVVVGNKGMGRATRFRLGSVPDRIAHYTPCDLLIVDTTGRVAEEGGGQRGFESILVATDGSPTAAEATRKAFDLAALLGSEVTLLYVGDPVVGSIRLEETASAAPRGVPVHTRVEQGDPAEQIIEIAEREGIDLVVVGNKGMSGPRRFLGSVPNKVAHYSATDVLVVKTADRTAEDLAPGHGGVVNVDGRRLAVYRDPEGHVYTFSPRCTHMGCTVDWNDAETTWDCPCHGSRFHADGSVLRGPAARPLEAVGDTLPPPSGEAATATGAAPVPPPRRRRGERFVIVGASLAGGTAAATLREEGFDGRVVLIGAEPAFPYERPPLSKSFMRGESTIEEAFVRPPSFYGDRDVETRFGTTATAVDTSTRRVLLAGDDPVPYDRLLVATGARNRRFPIPGLSLDGVYDLRTVTDAAAIRAELLPGRHVVVAGMGFIGSELAASFRRRGLNVTAVDGGSVPLERVLGADVGSVLAAIHREEGVRTVFDDRVAAFEGNGRVRRVVTANGSSIDCDFVVVGLGVEPVTDLLAGSGVEVDNGVLVDELCRTNVEGVYAAGDVANHWHPVFRRRVRTEHWQNAIEQGRAAALSMLDRGTPYEEVHWFWSDQYDHRLEYAGHHVDWDDLVFRGAPESRDFAAFYLKDGRVQSVVAMNGATATVRESVPLIRAGTPVDPGRLRDPGAELPALVGPR